MKIYEYRPGNKLSEGCSAVAIGLFDGFHVAHRELIKKTKATAKKCGLSCGIFTFASNESIKKESKKIYSTKEKLKIAESLGMDFAVVADFKSISNLSAEKFVNNTLIRDISAKIATVGFNFRFGKGASADASTLVSLMREAGGDALIFDEYAVDGISVSSTLIRELLLAGDIKKATVLLGQPYFLEGRVARGDGRGKRLGLPTVNIEIQEEKLLPKIGVYLSAVSVEGKIYSGVTNLGSCPTFGARAPHAETHILDFSEELYEKKIRVYLLDFLREEKPFNSEKELIMQIKLDIECAIKRNGEEKWQELGLK